MLKKKPNEILNIFEAFTKLKNEGGYIQQLNRENTYFDQRYLLLNEQLSLKDILENEYLWLEKLPNFKKECQHEHQEFIGIAPASEKPEYILFRHYGCKDCGEIIIEENTLDDIDFSEV